MEETWPTIIICVVLALIAALAIRSYLKKLRNGCCGAGEDGVKKVWPSDRNIEHYSYGWKIKIDGMSCKNCALRIENTFHEKEGFYAKVSLKNREAVVYVKSPVPKQELVEIVERAGYRVAGLKQTFKQ